MQHAADEARACIAQAEAELQARRAAESAARLAAEAAMARQAARAAEAASATAPASPPSTVAASPASKTPEQTLVMVADDSKIVRVKTGRLLAQHRYQVVYAIDGLEAVQQIEASMPDVVITDVDMPGMNGFELTRHVRQNPLTAHIPVIMITAADDKHRADADRAGVSVLLGKPYPEDELIAHIRRAMNRAAARAGVPA
jgi:CheY-like chemotaxis protein